MQFDAMKENNWLDLMSDTARDLFLPQGIFYWSGRAGKEADINATIGTAAGWESDIIPGGKSDKWITYYIPSVREKMRQIPSDNVFPYAPILGLPGFRKAWREWIVKKTTPHFPFDADLLGSPMVVPGASPGLFYLVKMFLSPGEALVCPDKRWENYDLMFTDCLGVPIESYPFFENAKPAPENLEKKLVEVAKKQDKLVTMLNFPNNPTGYMPSRAEGEAYRDAIVNAANATGKTVVVLFDDAYDGYVFDETGAPISIFGMFVGLHPNVLPVKVDGVSKELLWYGGRTACITFAFHPDLRNRAALEKEVENKVGALVRGTVSNSVRLVQEAVSLALADPDTVFAERKVVEQVLSARCAALKQSLKSLDPKAAYPEPFNSGFFCLLNVNPAVDADALADHLLKQYRTGVIPMKDAALGINAIRVAFCSVDVSHVAALVDAIGKGIADLS